MRQASDQVRQASVRRRLRDDALSVLKSLLLVGITTIVLLIVEQFFSKAPDSPLSSPGRHRSDELGNGARGHRGNCERGCDGILLLSADLQLSDRRPATSGQTFALRLRRDRHWAFGDQSQATTRSSASQRN